MSPELLKALESPWEGVSEELCEKAWNWQQALGYCIKTPAVNRIGCEIANHTAKHGSCSLSHNELGAQASIKRRHVYRSIRKMIDGKFIEVCGRSADGSTVYRACWERGDEWLAWHEAFVSGFNAAKKARKLKHFEAPPYPYHGAISVSQSQ